METPDLRGYPSVCVPQLLPPASIASTSLKIKNKTVIGNTMTENEKKSPFELQLRRVMKLR